MSEALLKKRRRKAWLCLRRFCRKKPLVALGVLAFLFATFTLGTMSKIVHLRDTNTYSTDVIVYLAQFGHHSSYGMQTDGKNDITGTSKLNRSLETLYSNYVHAFPCDPNGPCAVELPRFSSKPQPSDNKAHTRAG